MRVRVGLLLCIGWLSPIFEFMKQWFPRFAEIEAPVSVHVIWMHVYFDGFSDETIHVAGFCREEFDFSTKTGYNSIRYKYPAHSTH